MKTGFIAYSVSRQLICRSCGLKIEEQALMQWLADFNRGKAIREIESRHEEVQWHLEVMEVDEGENEKLDIIFGEYGDTVDELLAQYKKGIL
jgi:hypothetical protein